MHTSNRTKILEISAVVITGLGKFLFVDYLQLKFWYILLASLFWIGYIGYRVSNHPGILQYWGFSRVGFRPSLKVVVPVSVISITGFVVYGILQETIILNSHLIPVLMLYPLWGTLQQFLIIGILVINFKEMKGINIPPAGIVLFASVVFAIVHYPSWPLIGATFLLAIFYSILYMRYKNLWVLGLFHGWLGGLFYFFVLHRDPWAEFLAAVVQKAP